ncbi:DUF6153 family protein [Streptomyces abikoensis]|uniref:DUF6153 family protein n=1 Tax=Streptomyces abikoensis TaxID=97398 RepID=UPI0016726192|nr:DUF6153 family protein [Streptomyces abikoensis]GGP54390.1 hypothetical protein GCM10010214_29330 [Streptomyces abikoensis]
MHGRRRVAAWCGRLLLFAALLLGIVTMHTLGHPRDHGTTAGTHATASGGHAMASAGHATPGAGHASVPAASTPHGGGHGGMDPLSVCLAVLGTGSATAFLLALALAAFLRFFPDRPGTGPVATRAWFSRALWPVPPPPRQKALARLSVLRV